MTEINNGITRCAETARRMVTLVATAGYQWSSELSGATTSRWDSHCADDIELSEFLEAPPGTAPPGTGCERRLSVVTPFVAEGTSYAIPLPSMVFVPGVLRTFATRFRVGVRGPDYISGTYRGRIRLTGLSATTAQVDEMDVIVDL
ncbi:MAG: hypothetical protein ABI253_10775 [Mycobacterium sp.]